MSIPISVSSDPTSLTIVCCVEAGVLEPMVIRMVESLRRHGGSWAQTPVWAITPRFGPSIARATREKFSQLSIEHRVIREPHPYQWFGMWNKIAAVSYAEEHAQTEYMAFIDSDVLFTGEPDQLVGSDFSACVHGNQHLGTTGPGDANEPL